MRNWREAVEKILGPGYLASESDMNGYVFAAGESRTVFTPRDPGNNPLNFDKSNPVWVKMNKERLRITAEICYCSTLGECWTLRAAGRHPAPLSKPVAARVRRRLLSNSSQCAIGNIRTRFYRSRYQQSRNHEENRYSIRYLEPKMSSERFHFREGDPAANWRVSSAAAIARHLLAF